MIHPTAIIHPKAQVDPTVDVGPYAIIDEHVSVGPGCTVGPLVYLTGHTSIGSGNRFHSGCVIGDAPQDLKYKNEPTRLRIGNNNVFREQVTIHRSNKLEEDTIVGSENMLMANSHLGHNVILGDHVIIANGALLAGHVVIGDRAFISGNCLIHQFVRVGSLAMMQGGSRLSKDLPPFAMGVDTNMMCGLNITGLRRNGFRSETRLELKTLYRELFRSGQNLRAAVDSVQSRYKIGPARQFLDFIMSGKRGLCRDVGWDGEE